MRQINVLVPGARVELAWIFPNDFESLFESCELLRLRWESRIGTTDFPDWCLGSCQSSTSWIEKSRAVSVSSLFPKEWKTRVEGIFHWFSPLSWRPQRRANSLGKDEWKRNLTAYLLKNILPYSVVSGHLLMRQIPSNSKKSAWKRSLVGLVISWSPNGLLCRSRLSR